MGFACIFRHFQLEAEALSAPNLLRHLPNRLADDAGAPNAGVDTKGEGDAPKAGADAPKPVAAALLAAPKSDGVEAAPNAGVLVPPTGACASRAVGACGLPGHQAEHVTPRENEVAAVQNSPSRS